MPMPSPKQYDNHCINGMPCQQELTPIIPVRFSLTRNALENIKKGKLPNSPEKTKIGNNDYELRRLRQGYLYIYAELGMANNSTDGNETKEGHWQIFEYYVNNDDANGAMAPDMSATSRKKMGMADDPSQKSGGIAYHFRKYLWKDGTARGEWVLDTKSYPYAFVHKQVTRIYYAYSERRWAPKFFELLESNSQVRSSIMQQVSLANDSTDFSLLFSQLTTNVADFNVSRKDTDSADSLTRATSLGFSEKHRINILKEEEKQRARIIAVHDPIANLADISALHELTWLNMIQARRKYLYPTTTAKAVLQLKPLFRDGWFKNLPYDKKNEEELKRYAANNFYDSLNEFKEMEDSIKNLALAHKTLMEQKGKYTLCSLLECLTEKAEQFVQKDEIEALNELNMQASLTVKLAMQGIGISDQGMKVQADMLAKDSIYGGYVGKIISTAQRVELTYRNLTKSKGLNRLELELMYESLMTAQFYRWSSQTLNKKSITRESYLAAFGLTRVSMTMTGKGEKVSNRLEKQIIGFLQDKVQIQPTPTMAQTVVGATIAETKTGLTFDLIVPSGQDAPQQAQKNVIMSHKMGIFLAGLALLDTYKSLKESPNNPEWDSAAQSTYALTSLVAMFYYEKNGITNDALKNTLSANKTLLSSLFGEQHVILQRVDKVIKGSRLEQIFIHLGHFANFIGILVAIADVAKGWSKNDSASTISGILMGGAQTSLFFSEMAWVGRLGLAGWLSAIGWILFAASMVYYYFADNEAEAWVRAGFWGNSDDYWGKDRSNTIFNNIENAKVLGFPSHKEYKKISNFYEKEMESFYNLVLGISIQNDVSGDNKLRVYSPLFDSDESVNKLSIEWTQQTVWGEAGERGEQYTDLGSANVKKRRLLNHCIELDFSGTQPLGNIPKPDWRNQGRTVLATQGVLTIKYPKLGSSTEHFTAQRVFGKGEI